MEKEAKYRRGDTVFVRTLEDLIDEFGEVGRDIPVPSNFVYDMRSFCGNEVIIERVIKRRNGGFTYTLQNDPSQWKFDECVLTSQLVADVDPQSFEISFDSLF